MPLSDAFDAPVSLVLDGETVNLPILEVDDLLALGREVLQERKLAELKAVAIQDTAGRQNVTAFYDTAELDIDDLIKLTLTLTGARRFVTASVRKAGIADPAAFVAKASRALGQRGIVNLAAMVSGIWPVPAKEKAPAPPNDGAAAVNPDAAASLSPSIGSPSDSPSGNASETQAA